ncbi:MAG: lipase secretion chaperone [Pseudomonadota bacterium]
MCWGLYLALVGRNPAHASAPAATPDYYSFVKAMPETKVVPAPQAVAAPPALLEVEAKVGKLRAGGGNADEVYRVRAQALPAATVARLVEMEEAEVAWRRRVDAYHADPGIVSTFTAQEKAQLELYAETQRPQLR